MTVWVFDVDEYCGIANFHVFAEKPSIERLESLCHEWGWKDYKGDSIKECWETGSASTGDYGTCLTLIEITPE